MSRRRLFSWLVVMSLSATAVLADSPSRPDHFQGLAAHSLEEAVRNFSEYNRKLEEVLAQPTLDLHQLQTVHELTYTLENALEKIRADLGELAQTLEAIHVASEHADAQGVKRQGQDYLRVARTVIE